MATFLVCHKLRFSRRPGVFLVGEIQEGTVRKGMIIRQCRDQGVLAPVTAIDFIDPGGHVTLRIQCDRAEDEKIVDSACPNNQAVEVIDPEPR